MKKKKKRFEIFNEQFNRAFSAITKHFAAPMAARSYSWSDNFASLISIDP